MCCCGQCSSPGDCREMKREAHVGRCLTYCICVRAVTCVQVCLPVVSLPEELYVDQIRGFGDALSVRLH